MRNRAKCKICLEILESFTREDYVHCRCGEIAITGGSYALECFANDFNNFMRIDDDGNEIIVDYKESTDKETQVLNGHDFFTPTKKELLEMLDEFIKRIQGLPIEAALQPTTHADFASLSMLLAAILKSE